MTRQRFDGLTATLAAPLSPGDTTVTFTTALLHDGGEPVPSLTPGDVIAMSVLTTARELSEIIHVTAYTTGAATATITRGMEGSTAKTHATGVRVISAGNVLDFDDAAFAANSQATALVMGKLRADKGDASIVVVGDSTTSFDGTPWTQRLAVRLGEEFPTYTVKFAKWNGDNDPNTADPGDYGSWDTLQTGSGANTLWFRNGGAAGTNARYPLSRLDAMVVVARPDLVIVDHGINEFTYSANHTPESSQAQYLCLTEAIREACSGTPLLLMTQHFIDPADAPLAANSYVSAEWQRRVAQSIGAGLVDIAPVFQALGAAIQDYLDAGAHCNDLGQELYLAIIWRQAFSTPVPALAAQLPSSFIQPAGRNILVNGEFSSFDGSAAPTGWTVAHAALAKDTTNFDVSSGNAYSLKMTSDGAGQAKLTQSIGGAALDLLKGKYVTLCTKVRQDTPAAITGTQLKGIPTLNDGVTFATGIADTWSDDAFVYHAVTLRVDETSTNLAVALFCDSGAANAGTINQWAWATLVEGILPSIPDLLSGQFLRTNYPQILPEAFKQQAAINGAFRRAPEGGFANLYWNLAGQGSAPTALVLTASREYAVPFEIVDEVDISTLVVAVTALAASSTVRLGIRPHDPVTGFPLNGPPLLDAGTVDSTTTGDKSIVLGANLNLKPGWYWYTVTAQGGAPSVRSSPVMFPGPLMSGATSVISNEVSGYYQAGVTGALPSTFTIAGLNTSDAPRMAARRV